MSNETKPQGLFDKLYAAGKEVIDAAKKSMVRNSIKRKLSAAYDDAASKRQTAELNLQKVREDFNNYDLNVVLTNRATIDQCNELMERIKQEHQDLFLKPLVTGEDDEA